MGEEEADEVVDLKKENEEKSLRAKRHSTMSTLTVGSGRIGGSALVSTREGIQVVSHFLVEFSHILIFVSPRCKTILYLNLRVFNSTS